MPNYSEAVIVNVYGGGGSVGVLGSTDVGTGVEGASTTGTAVQGVSGTGPGVLGYTNNGERGILGCTDPVFGQHAGVYGESDQQGVLGHATSDTGTGVFGNSSGGGFGVRGETNTGTAVQGQSFGPTGMAGRFLGNVSVSGTLSVDQDIILYGADCAEQFEVAAQQHAEPGTVLVICTEGALGESESPYDRRVAGVVSGGGKYRPGIILDGEAMADNSHARVALIGKVYCKVDADHQPIEVGDLLTTSSTPGHAMRVTDPSRAVGAVLGKALHPMPTGKGMIPILVALQ